MTATERITTLWLGSKGYFVMPNIKVGRREIDCLAVKLTDDKESIHQKVHVEVQVSPRPFGSRRSDETYRQDADDYVQSKFETVKSKVQEILGLGYSRWIVVGKSAGGEQELKVWTERMKELGVQVFRFEHIVAEYIPMLDTWPTSDEAAQLLFILENFGLLKLAEA